MILLDTNVVSELWRPQRNLGVERWVDAQPRAILFVSAITIGELRFGAYRLPDGRRKDLLLEVIAEMGRGPFAERVLPFDTRCTDVFGRLRADRERLGRPITFADAAIAAIALTYDLSLATRNTRDFEELDVELINPFEA
jgi:hypothetical protein